MFWEDVHSQREQAWLQKKNKATLPENTHPLLGNWAVAGRQQLKLDGDIQTAENYEFDEPVSRLQHVQHDFLQLETSVGPQDDTIRVVKTGGSKLREVEVLRDQMLELRKRGILFEEMRVYAPDIELYASLLEFVCREQIPVRIASREQYKKSPFIQTLLLLFEGADGYWTKDEMVKLFGNQEKVKQWIEQGHIRWGLDAEHRSDLSSVSNPAGTWQQGINSLLDRFIRLQPDEPFGIAWSDAEEFEQFAETFDALKTTLRSWKTPRSFPEWADTIEAVAKQFFITNDQPEFFQYLETLRNCSETTPVPLALARALFDPHRIEEAPALHTVRCATLERGSIFPAKAVFLLGMDEESFPRMTPVSSTEKLPESIWDRYLFLQALFSAQQQLTLSYGDQSPEDGKLRGPSCVVSELMSYIGLQPVEATTTVAKVPQPQAAALWQPLSVPAPVPTIQTLNQFVRHPIRHYLEHVLHLSLPEEPVSLWPEFEYSPLQTHRFLQDFLGEKSPSEMPLGIFGQHTKLVLDEKTAQFKQSLESWGIDKNNIDSKVLHMGDDTIRGMIRRWPELLAALCSTGTTAVHCLRTGRIREVQDPKTSLQKIETLFAEFHGKPLLFHADWADDLLRKNRDPQDKTEDLVVQWMLDRCPGLDCKREWQTARELLRETLSSLITLFPTRGSHAAV
jgi:exonuclease V gamma subunit